MKIKLAGLLLLATTIFAMPALAQGSDCRVKEHEELIQETEALIKDAVPLLEVLENPHDTMWGVESACTVLSFKISEEGKAESIRVVQSEPNRVLERAAIHALRKYRFCVPENPDERHGMLLFRLSLDEIDE